MASDNRVIDGSSIVEMEIIGDDQSDYDVDLSSTAPMDNEFSTASRTQSQPQSLEQATKSQIASGVANYVWQEGRQRAQKAFSIYGNIDILRPYFDVEPDVVRKRLIHSLIPKIPHSGSQQEKVPRELYGPTMLVFTMIALLLFQMKVSEHKIEEGTLMGTAFGVCFTYWLGVSGLLWSMSYVVNTHLSMLQILSLLGYALFGHCITLFLGTAIHSNHSHMMFYMLWLIFGGLSTLRMVSILYARTSGRTQRMIVCGLIATLHMLFLLYLHFAYHKIVEDLSYALRDEPVNPQIVLNNDDLIDNKQPNDAVRLAESGAKLVDPGVESIVTESVKRLLREVHVPAELTHHNESLDVAGSKIIQAVAPQAMNMVDNGLVDLKSGIQQAGNAGLNLVHNATARIVNQA